MSMDVGDPVLELTVLQYVIISAIVQIDPTHHKPGVRQVCGLLGTYNLSNMILHQGNSVLPTYAVLPRL